MRGRDFTRLAVVVVLCFAASALGASNRFNVLFIAVDDMKDWVNCLGGYEGTVYTPHIDRLARRGMLFTNAHCASPKCAPSRAAIMTGLRPSTTGLYDNGHWWLPNLPDVVTMPVHFRAHGYRVVGAGKIFHHTAGNNPPNQWDDFFRLTFRNDPHEWTNLAASAPHDAIKQELAGWIAKDWAKSALTKGAFRFDPNDFTWTHKKTGHIIRGQER